MQGGCASWVSKKNVKKMCKKKENAIFRKTKRSKKFRKWAKKTPKWEITKNAPKKEKNKNCGWKKSASKNAQKCAFLENLKTCEKDAQMKKKKSPPRLLHGARSLGTRPRNTGVFGTKKYAKADLGAKFCT